VLKRNRRLGVEIVEDSADAFCFFFSGQRLFAFKSGMLNVEC
jgi:hypothetical protein